MNYETVIGLEIHCELSTKTKIFCGCDNSFGGGANTHVCPGCAGMPGTLPVLNEKVVEYAIKAGLALNCSITPYCISDRKHYFYPDLPSSYQISQLDLPLCGPGFIDIEVADTQKRIGITRIHIEADAGKLVHEFGDKSGVDFNRSCVALIEIVTEPDMRSPEEAVATLETIRNILKYIGVSDCKMQEGSLRCDVNVSIRPFGQEKFGVRTEMKNINSFKAVERGIRYEVERQKEVLAEGGTLVQQTRKWDDNKGSNSALRNKETATDYRYLPDPDLAPIVTDEAKVESIRKTLPELPKAKRARFEAEYTIPAYDANILSASPGLADFFEKAANVCKNAKAASNWLMGDVMKIANEKEIEMDSLPFSPEYLGELIVLIEKGTISGPIAKKVLPMMFDENKSPEALVKEHGLVQISDEGAIKDIILTVFANNPQSLSDYKAGKKQATGYLIGQAMRELKGKGNPQIVNRLVTSLLEEQ